MLSNFNFSSIFEDKSSIRIFKIISVFLFCFIIMFQGLNICLGYDDAINAVTSKNIALGAGYSLSYNGIIPFSPHITTGITMIMPVALAIKLFSNQYWIPSAVSSLIILFLLLVVMYLPKKIKTVTEKQLWIWRSVFMGLLIFASNLKNTDSFIIRVGEIPIFNGALSMMLGEFPAVFLFIISIFLLVISNNRKYLYFIAGFTASLAFLTKTLILISLLPAFFMYLFFNLNLSGKRTNFLIFSLAGFLAPIFLNELYKFISVGGMDLYLAIKKSEYVIFKTHGSGIINNHIPVFDKIKYMVLEIGFVRLFIFFAVSVYMALYYFVNKHNREVNIIFLILSVSSLVNAIWWFAYSLGWIRHLLIGWVIFITMISLLVFIINEKNKYVFLIIIILFLTTPCSSRIDKIFLDLNQYIDIQMVKKQALFEARDFIINNKQYNYYGASWWANRRLEYILPTINNFSDAMDASKFNQNIKNKVLVRDIEYWNWWGDYNIEKLRQHSEKRIIFQNTHYVMSLYVEE